MPRQATAVIGANFGDEGKGAMVDYFASKASAPCLVVRANGGAQAGHTVVAEGHRHVFGHFGSGTLAGAETYLGKHFVCNPMLFWHEHQQLGKLGVVPIVGVDPRCFITTPADMLINQALEDARGAARHGSCGLGFGETIERNRYPSFTLTYADLESREVVVEKLKRIRDRWIPGRARYLKLDPAKIEWKPAYLESWIEVSLLLRQMTRMAGAEFLRGKDVIFEGAQGLGLDMHDGLWPHVTRSNTGLRNVLPIAQASAMRLQVWHVSRAYLTRHGAGPLPGEFVPDPPIEDRTNTFNIYQGALRFATLDPGALQDRISKDLASVGLKQSSLALTCVDQVGASTSEALRAALNPRLVRFGPRREDISPA